MGIGWSEVKVRVEGGWRTRACIFFFFFGFGAEKVRVCLVGLVNEPTCTCVEVM